jgi:hypothetical protein
MNSPYFLYAVHSSPLSPALVNNLKHERERDKEQVVGGVRDTTFNRREKENFLAVKVPRQCPLVLLVKVG